jgi:hypothetical protein
MTWLAFLFFLFWLLLMLLLRRAFAIFVVLKLFSTILGWRFQVRRLCSRSRTDKKVIAVQRHINVVDSSSSLAPYFRRFVAIGDPNPLHSIAFTFAWDWAATDELVLPNKIS